MQAVIIEIEKPSDAKFWLDLAKKKQELKQNP